MHQREGVQERRQGEVHQADGGVGLPVAAPLRVEAGNAEPGRQHQPGDQQAPFGGQDRAEHRRGDAHEDERSAPDRRKQREARVVGGFHGRIIADRGGPRWPFPDLAPRCPKTASRGAGRRAHNAAMTLDPHTCYRALKARDARFDGRFFVAVSSTRIYCRPVCTVKPPKRENCRFYPSAAAAESGGYRPCLRCRPGARARQCERGRDLAPGAGRGEPDGGPRRWTKRAWTRSRRASASPTGTCAARSAPSSASRRWNSRRRSACCSPSAC